jgi:hypothetical protein
MYQNYKNVFFLQLLDSPTVAPEDKHRIRDLLANRKWNQYVMRHTAATELSKVLKDPVLIDKYMDWSHQGNTHLSISTIILMMA